MNIFERHYKEALFRILNTNQEVKGRNGRVLYAPAVQLYADLAEGFPLVTSKKIFPKSIAIETEWFLSGQTNIKFLQERGVHIWDQWADEKGELGPIYGKQLRDFNGIDQLKWVLKEAKANPGSRRLVVNLWNPAELEEMRLPPCHYSFQFIVGRRAHIVVSMRSLDLFVGFPYDMAMYGLILAAFCEELDLTPGKVFINAAHAHIYMEHKMLVAGYIERPSHIMLAELENVPKLSAFKADEVKIVNYKSESRIPVDVKL